MQALDQETLQSGLQLQGNPVPDGLRVPEPFAVNPDGVWMLGDNCRERALVVSLPVVPVRIMLPAAGTEGVQRVLLVVARPDGTQEYRWVPCSTLASHFRITALADIGVLVDSLAAQRAVAYFSAMLRENLPPRGSGMQISYSVDCMGWQELPPYGRTFVLGRAAYTGSGGCQRVTAVDESGPPADIILEAGVKNWWLAQALGAIRERGSVAGWAQALAGLEQYSRALLALYASFVPPLLELLELPNFIVEYAHESSVGKTTALRVAASVWGVPDTLGGGGGLGYVVPGDATKNALEGIAGVYSGLPLVLDEMHRMPPDAQAQAIYMLAHGAGKSRATPTGLQSTRTFRTVAIVSTERSIVGHRYLGGVAARVLSVQGAPLSGVGQRERDWVERVRRELAVDHGVAGPVYVRHLLQRLADGGLAAERQEARRFADQLRARGLPDLAARYAEYAEVLALAAVLAHQCLPLPWDLQAGLDALADTLAACASELGEQDLGSVALQYLQSRLSPLVDTEAGEVVAPPGRQVVGSARQGKYVALLPHFFEDLLRARGLDPGTVLRVFAERGWIYVSESKGRRFLRTTWRYRGEMRRMVVLRWRPLMESEGPV